ncbi:MAG: hypothetical protein JHC26_00385 [Thermofilum sp.]|uniref:hypothetical protein n=1 Tax=Thermofilum sp. TaxID=1961369 RepID=UPI0025870039|nr:hypothetical protein [Thermofilum sp.]MCI4407522.1 hypothetical protein [Thermofilum sp.]
MEKLLAIIMLAVSFLALLFFFSVSDYVIGVLISVTNYINSLVPAGTIGFVDIGSTVDNFISRQINPIIASIVILVVFVYIAHERQR